MTSAVQTHRCLFGKANRVPDVLRAIQNRRTEHQALERA